MNQVNSHACEQRSPGICHSNFARKTSVVQRSQWLIQGPIQSAQWSNKSSSAALKAIVFPTVVNCQMGRPIPSTAEDERHVERKRTAAT